MIETSEDMRNAFKTLNLECWAMAWFAILMDVLMHQPENDNEQS